MTDTNENMNSCDLTVVIPCYNEEKTISITLQKVLNELNALNILFELIVVNDGSTDDTANQLKPFCQGKKIKEITHERNKGKGASIRAALNIASGKIFVIQDADLEYDPKDISRFIGLVLDDKADVVYGSRFKGGEPHRVLFFFHTIGNKILTFFSNLLTGINLTDMETGYKMFRTDKLRSITLIEDRFGFEPEVTAKISRLSNIRIFEVGISYYGRTYNEGKKIQWQDGFRAIYCILKYNLFQKK